MSPASTIQAAGAERQRLSLDLAPGVSSLLDHIATVTGVPRSQVVTQALLDAMPGLLERADALQRRAQTLGKPGGKR